jgi:hypothetical protein
VKITRGDLAVLAALVLLPTVLWWPLLAGALPDFMDTVVYLYPIRMALARQLADGTLPLWNPHMMAGVPMAANPQLATWYLPQVLFYLMPGPLMYGVLCILHAAWGGAGAFFFVRHFTRERVAGFFAGVVFVMGPFVVSRLALAPHLYTVVWIPWILLAVEHASRERGWLPGRGGCLVAVALAMQILAGSPQITYYTALVLPLWWLVRAWSNQPAEPPVRLLMQTASQGALAALVAFLLAGIQLLPALEFVAQTSRAAIAPERLMEQGLNGSMAWRALVGFTAPEIEDTDSIHAVGLGVTVLALAAAFASKTRGVALPLVLFGLLGWLLSLGVLVPFWSAVLPGVSGFHAPRRALVLWSAVAPLAAGMGAGLLSQRWRARYWPRWSLKLLLLAFALGTVWIVPRLEREFADPARFEADPRVLSEIGRARFVTIDPSLRWSHGSRDEDFGRSLISNLAALHGLHDANGYDPLILKRMADLRTVASGRAGVWYASHGVYLPDPMSSLWRVLNVQHVVGRMDLFEPSELIPGTSIDWETTADYMELTVEDERWPLWSFKEERHFAWSVEQAYEVPAAEDALDALLRRDGFRSAFVEGMSLPFARFAKRSVRATWRDARTLAIQVDNDAEGEALVCVSVAWMPGWTAWTNEGERLNVYPAQGVICGIPVPEGVSEFTMRYAPLSFTRGWLLSLGGVMLLSGLWLRGAKKRHRNAPRVGHEGERKTLGG